MCFFLFYVILLFLFPVPLCYCIIQESMTQEYNNYFLICSESDTSQYIEMIKIGVLKSRQREAVDKLNSAKTSKIRHQLSQYNFCLTDDNCYFQVSPNLCVKDNFIAIQIRASPYIGLYSGIDFLVTIFMQDCNIKPPKIFNDRRIFHPNINPYTFEFAIPEAINWNPTNTLIYLLRRLKYTIIQPNSLTIPNNHYCKKAACLYRLDRENYRNYVIQYCPTVLGDLIDKETQNSGGWDGDGRMADDYGDGPQPEHNQKMEDQQHRKQIVSKKYLEINQIVPMSRIKINKESSDFGWDDEEDFQFLNKRLSCMRIQSEIQNNDRFQRQNGNNYSNYKQTQTNKQYFQNRSKNDRSEFMETQ